jgi:NAD(P)-dependent dehydrogenase (short-subunit alcohol dehydrogenase family)
LRLLVLGGTRFVGRALVDAALRHGDEVTLFNRGLTNPELFPDAEKIRGARTEDLSALAGGEWDAVVDVSAYVPRHVQQAADAVGDRQQVPGRAIGVVRPEWGCVHRVFVVAAMPARVRPRTVQGPKIRAHARSELERHGKTRCLRGQITTQAGGLPLSVA